MTVTQPQEALVIAQEVRSKRCRLKKLMAEGRLTLSDVLRADKAHLNTMRVHDLLHAVPGLGESRIRRILQVNGIGHSVTLGELPHFRRGELVAWIRTNYPRTKV